MRKRAVFPAFRASFDLTLTCALALAACAKSGDGGDAAPGGGAGTFGLPTAGTGVSGSGAGTSGAAGNVAQAGSGAAGSGESGSGGSAGLGGAGTGDVDGGGITYVVDPIGNANRAPGFVDLSPPMGDPLDGKGNTVSPTPPAGWVWYDIAGTFCRDGSGTGFYVRQGSADKLFIYFEGGGACSNDHYCAFNPASVNTVLAGDGEVVIGSTLGTGAGRQQPGVYTDGNHNGPPVGVFDTSKAENPFKDWNMVYIPYCTGDVHFGTNENGKVPNLAATQKFVGYRNTQKFIGRLVPTFKDKVSKVAIGGSSAGGFAAALNYSMIQDAFGDVPVFAIDDSGPPFEDKYMPACMQEKWRAAWGLDDALPPDCAECFQADGGNLIHLADFLLRKHPNARLALISSMQDEVIRLFFSVGLVDCKNYDTADPVATVLLQFDATVYFPATQYEGGLNGLRSTYLSTNRFATYYMGGANINRHQHLFRQRFYEQAAGGKSIAKFVSDFLGGTVEQLGP